MQSCLLKCPVTALKCYQDVLLAGQKSRACIISLSSHKVLLSKKVFKRSSIHSFIILECGKEVLVLGGKSVRIIKLNVDDVTSPSFSYSTQERELEGWIWDALRIDQTKFALISAHNTVLIWNVKTDLCYPVVSCDEQCILYSASLDIINKDIVIAAGTVFNQVLLWKPNNAILTTDHIFVDTWKRFHGHEGVIFRMRFHPSLAQLLSVSDDRSIRIWDIESESCLQILYGHTARVWDAMFAEVDDNKGVVSVGEDATCIVWKQTGDDGEHKLWKKFTGHKGKSIWSLDINDSHIFTGGGDGAIRRWNMRSSTSQALVNNAYELPKHQNGKEADDFPKVVKLLDDATLLLSTNNGKLMKFEEESQEWALLHSDASFFSYCILDVHEDIVAMGNLTGKIKLLSISGLREPIEEKVFDGKIFSILFIIFQSNLYLLVTGPEGVIKLFLCECETMVLTLVRDFCLPYSKQRWLTSGVIVTNSKEDDGFLLACGDRRGSLHLFNTLSMKPVHSLLGVHGKTGVTCIVHYGDNVIYTTGRNGKFCKYEIDGDANLKMIDKQKVCKGMDWIEGLLFRGDDVIVYGFYMQSHFALWSFQRNEILFKVQCGGGYRSWDLHLPSPHLQKQQKLYFAYLKGPVLHTVSSTSAISNTSAIVMNDVHGREVLFAKVLGVSQDYKEWLISTGSEDTTINFLTYNTVNNSIKSIHTAVGHIGGVKDACFVPYLSENLHTTGIYGMFISCGSRTSLKVWEIKSDHFSTIQTLNEKIKNITNGTEMTINNEISNNNAASNTNDFSCSLSHEIFNPEINPKQLKNRTGEFIDDMRYLSCDALSMETVLQSKVNEGFAKSVCCVCACSDGFARLYILQNHHAPVLLAKLGYGKHCVLIVHLELADNTVLLFTTSTDGCLYIWNISSILDYKTLVKRINICDNKIDSAIETKYKISGEFKEIAQQNHKSVLELNGNQALELSELNNVAVFDEEQRNPEFSSVGQIKTSVERFSAAEYVKKPTKHLSRAEHVNRTKFKFHEIDDHPLVSSIEPMLKIKSHQSGINSLNVLSTKKGFLLATGGDDNAVNICEVSKDEKADEWRVVKQCKQESGHCSSITGVRFINESHVVTSSIDQRIRLWNVNDLSEPIKDVYTDVADVTNLEVWQDRNTIHLIVTGIGLEIFRFDDMFT